MSCFRYVILLLVWLSCGAQAAIDGEVAPVSSGLISIRLDIMAGVQITDLRDIELRIADKSRDFHYRQHFCVRGNIGERYAIIAGRKDPASQHFYLVDERGNRLLYELYFTGSKLKTTPDRLYPGARSPVYAVTADMLHCSGGGNVTLELVVPVSDMLGNGTGIYSGDITLTVVMI